MRNLAGNLMMRTDGQSLLNLLRESQHWSASRLQELQWAKLQSLLIHAYNSCEFYKQRFDAVGLHHSRDFHSFECLQKLPVLTKEDIQGDLESIRTSDPSVSGIELNSTGGSTGKPLNFYQDDNYRCWADAARDRAWRCFPGVSRRALEAILWGADRDVGRKISRMTLLMNVFRYRALPLNTFDLDPGKIRSYFRVYNLLRPQLLRGYASSLFFIANFLAEHEIQPHRPKMIISSAEMLWPTMRQRISKVFGADIIDSYGCREVSQIATECSQHCGLHLVMENQFVEVIDGQIIVTNLNNFGMPFIRYQVGDMAEYIETSPCACGREAHRLIGLRGRVTDTIELPGGRAVHGEFFTHLFYGLENVEQFQVVYSRSQHQLRVRISGNIQPQQIEVLIRKKMIDTFDFHDVKVEVADRFDKTATGKLRFVYSVDHFDEVGCHA